MIGIDSNLFLRWLLEDDKAKADAVARFVKKAEKDGEKLWAADIVLAEVVWVLDSVYEVSPGDIARQVERLLDVEVFEFENRDRLLRALEFYKAHNVDFIDCYIAASAIDRGFDSVASYDRDFDRLPVVRVVP